MAKLEQKRLWRTIVDAIQAPAQAAAWQRKQAAKRMMDAIKEHVEKGFPVNAQPYGPSMAELIAGMGGDHLPLLTRLFWSGANLSAPNTQDHTLPIEVSPFHCTAPSLQQAARPSSQRSGSHPPPPARESTLDWGRRVLGSWA